MSEIFVFRCLKGYKKNVGTGACEDIDECDTGDANCHKENQACLNTLGSYKCLDILVTEKSGNDNNSKCEEGYRYQARIDQCVGKFSELMFFSYFLVCC